MLPKSGLCKCEFPNTWFITKIDPDYYGFTQHGILDSPKSVLSGDFLYSALI